MSALAVNSIEWWNDYFRSHWEERGGREQTRGFMQRLVEALPGDVAAYMAAPGRTMLDWGCALGDGVEVLARTFPHADLAGLDVSSVALERARALYPRFAFVGSMPDDHAARYDVIITSNCLEHFDDPQRAMRDQMRFASGLYVVLVPFAEEPLCEYHRARFDQQTFPESVGGFVRHHVQIIDFHDSGLWSGKQMLVVYRWHRLQWPSDFDNSEIPSLPTSGSAALWDRVADQYDLEVTDAERELAGELCSLLAAHDCRSPATCLEVGSGSGHLSALLAGEGYGVTLLDFSLVALEKSRACFQHFNYAGAMVRGDLFRPPLRPRSFDVVWNSGVMEHFDHDRLVAGLAAMRDLSRRFVVVLVPNPQSLPYLLFRYKTMRDGQWSYGLEYLDQDMPAALAEAGITLVERAYVMNGMCGHYIRNVLDSPNLADVYEEASARDLVPAEQRYLVAYVGRVDRHDAKHTVTSAPRENEQGLRTALFDLTAGLTGLHTLRSPSGDGLARLEGLLREAGQFVDKLHEAEKSRHDENVCALERQLETSAQRADRATEQAKRHERALAELLGRIAEHDRQTAAILDEQRRTVGWRLLRFIRRIRHQLVFGSMKERRRFVGWFLRRLRGRLGDDGWRFELTLPPVWQVTTGMEGLPDALAPSGPAATSASAQDVLVETIAAFVREQRCVVILPVMEWNHPLFQRPHQLAKAYTSLGYRTVFLTPAVQYDRFGTKHLADNLLLVGGLLPERYADAIGGAASILVTTNLATNEHLFAHFPGARFVYEYIDELDVFDGYGPEFEKAHARLLRSADVVVCTARELYDKAQRMSDRCIYSPNAGDYDHFHAAIGQPLPDELATLRNGSQAVVGFYGALAKWLDYRVMRRVATQRPDWLYLLVGPDYDRSLKRSGLLDQPNVRWLGPRPYAELPRVLQAFDVATIPFRLDRVTHSVSPVKLFEYMAGGKPIVAAAVRECLQYESVLTARDAEEFVDRLDRAMGLRDDRDYLALLDRDARDNCWTARVRQIVDRLDRSEPSNAQPQG